MLYHRCAFLLLAVLQLSQAAIREPWVENLASFFQKDDCNKIIEAAETFGFPNSSDSIDYNEPRGTVSWAIDVVLDQMVEVPSIASIYDKYLPQLRDVVADRKFKMNNGDTSEPTLDWVFLRKYSAGEERRMLKLHHDINLFTLNLALNDNFEGGGLFYHKNRDEYFEHGNNLPEFPVEKLNYEFLDDLKRQNTSEIVFPNMTQGDLLIHNNTLFHAIAPLEKGTRYSLVFFYDMHHPDVKKFHQNPVPVRLDIAFDFPVDLYVVDAYVAEYSHTLLHENIDDEFFFEGIASHHYEIVDQENGQVVFEFDLYDDKEDGEEHVIEVGPHDQDDDENDQFAFIVNKFTYPVALYWVQLDEDGDPDERHLVEDPLEEEMALDTVLGHQFIVVNTKTDEIVHHFEVDDEQEDEGEFRITVGPHKQSASEGEL